jgi:hypothetical protein
MMRDPLSFGGPEELRPMGKPQDFEPAKDGGGFEERRVIDVTDEDAMRFWAQRLGVTEAEIAEVVRLVGPNSTAVALKLDAPQEHRVSPLPPR